jgi:hypothetical protein
MGLHGKIQGDIYIFYGPGRLRDFLDHLKSDYKRNEFTMETERDSHLSFWT